MKKKIKDEIFKARIASVLVVCMAKIYVLLAIYRPEGAGDFLKELGSKLEKMDREEGAG